MTSQLVSTTIRRANRNRMLWSAAGLIAVLVAGVVSLRYLTNFFAGPRNIDHAELLGLQDAASLDRYWVSVTGDDVVDRIGTEVTTGRYGSKSTTAYYQALIVDNRLLLVADQDVTAETTYTGALIPIDSETMSDIVTPTEADNDIEGAFLPYMLETDDFRFPGYIGFAVGGVVLALSLFGLTTALQRSDIAKHPIMKRLARHGEATVVISDLENELIAPRWSHGKLKLTQNWLAQTNSADFNAMRLNEVVWMYKHVTQRRVNGVPAGKTFAVHILDSHGHKIEATGKNENEVNTMIEGIHTAIPWVLTGYDAELEKAWKSNRAAVVNAVAQRRQSTLAQAASF